MIGTSSLWFALAASIVAVVLYAVSFRKNAWILYARVAFLATIVGIIVAAGTFSWAIVTHKFQYAAVAHYSSRQLPFFLLLSTFWAGQEGSFLLWALFAAIVGLVLFAYTVSRGREAEVMLPYVSMLFFLLLLLTVQSPFRFLWEVQKDIPLGFVPADGRGLNPLLQNFWMIIHPPFLFLGFVILTVPYSFAFSGLLKHDYTNWIREALPWLLLGIVFLGCGLIFGGYWAYGVLGWGGWWGWDPVENSSLVPWLLALILLHTILVQQSTGKLVRTNVILAIVTYLSVLYSTFLTRSGILADASVHSFLSAGTGTYSVLIAWIIITAVMPFGFLFRRWKNITISSAPSPLLSRESMLLGAALLVGSIVLVVLFGTSLPLLMKKTVETSFYNDTTLPLAACASIVLGISLLLQWREDGKKFLLHQLRLPALLAGAGTIGTFVLGVRDLSSLFLVITAFFALICSLQQGYRFIKEYPRAVGGALSHAGIALLLLAIVASGRYDRKATLTLQEGQPQNVFGADVTYLGALETPDGKVRFGVEIAKNDAVTILLPEMYYSEYTQSVMKNPDYWIRWNEDIYLEPLHFTIGKPQTEFVFEVQKDETFLYQNKRITFRRFQMAQHEKEMMQRGNTMTIGAEIEIVSGKEKEILVPITLYNNTGVVQIQPAYTKSDSIGFALLSIHVPTENEPARVRLGIVKPGIDSALLTPKDSLVVTLSVKPFMSVLWIAAFFILVGALIAWQRRRQEISFKEGNGQ